MSWREFVASLVDSLSWPLAVAVAAWLFRGQLAALLSLPLTRLKAGPFELSWERAVGAVSETTVALEPPPATDDRDDDEIRRLFDLADQTPVVAVRTAFGLIERELRELASGALTTGTEGVPAETLAAAAAVNGAVTPETAHAIRGLVTLRDLTAHDPSGRSVTPERAREYIVLAQGVLYALRTPPSRRR